MLTYLFAKISVVAGYVPKIWWPIIDVGEAMRWRLCAGGSNSMCLVMNRVPMMAVQGVQLSLDCNEIQTESRLSAWGVWLSRGHFGCRDRCSGRSCLDGDNVDGRGRGECSLRAYILGGTGGQQCHTGG